MMQPQHLPEEISDGFLEAWGGEVLIGAWLPGDAAHSAAPIHFALLHRSYGVALLDLSPDRVPEAAARFRQTYRARHQAGKVPPVVYRSLSVADCWRLTVVLDSAFAAEPPVWPGDDSWIRRARELLSWVPVLSEAEPEPLRTSLLDAAPAMIPDVRAVVVLEQASAVEAPIDARVELAEIRIPAVPKAAPGRLVEVAPVAAPAASAPRPGIVRQALPLGLLLLAVAGGAVYLGRLDPSAVTARQASLGAASPASEIGRSDPAMSAATPMPALPPAQEVVAQEGTVGASEEALPRASVPAGTAPAGEPVRAEAGVMAPAQEMAVPGAVRENAPSTQVEEAPRPVESPAGTVAASSASDRLPQSVLGPEVVGGVSIDGTAVVTELPILPAAPASPGPPLPTFTAAPLPALPEEPVAAMAPTPLPRPSSVPAAVAPPRPPPESVAPELLQALVRRGDAMLALGDVSAARLLYDRAAAAGSGAAATAMGRSYDPAALEMLRVRGLRGDPEAAAAWYGRGMALGDPEAEALARRLVAASHEGGGVP